PYSVDHRALHSFPTRRSSDLDSLEGRHRVLWLTAAGPGAERRGLVIGEGADHGEGFDARRERQDLTLVLEQDDRLFGHAPGELAVFGREQRRALALGCSAVVGIVEQAEGGLGAKHAAHRLVHYGDGNASGPDQCRQIAHVDAAHHVHIHAGLERELPRVRARAGDAVIEELRDRRPVAHYEALEAPLAAQDGGHEPGARGAWDAADLVE